MKFNNIRLEKRIWFGGRFKFWSADLIKVITNSHKSLSVEFQSVCMYGSEPRFSSVISSL